MKKNIMKKWVKALRSGEYVQGKGALCRVGKEYDYFCCLGVLTDIYMQEIGDLNITTVRSSTGENIKYDLTIGNLPFKVKKWSGMKSAFGVFNRGCLSYMNDSWNKDFKEIADIIERNWEKL